MAEEKQERAADVGSGVSAKNLEDALDKGTKDIRAEPIAADVENNGQKEEEQIRKAKTMAELELLDFEQDIAARKAYAGRIFWLIVGWLISVLAILLLDGFLSKNGTAMNLTVLQWKFKTAIHFELSDSVLLALIGGTTASVLGLFVIVANYLFPKRKEPN